MSYVEGSRGGRERYYVLSHSRLIEFRGETDLRVTGQARCKWAPLDNRDSNRQGDSSATATGRTPK